MGWVERIYYILPKFTPHARTASLVAETSWKPTEDVGHSTQGRPGTSLWTASLRLRTVEKGLVESLRIYPR